MSKLSQRKPIKLKFFFFLSVRSWLPQHLFSRKMYCCSSIAETVNNSLNSINFFRKTVQIKYYIYYSFRKKVNK